MNELKIGPARLVPERSSQILTYERKVEGLGSVETQDDLLAKVKRNAHELFGLTLAGDHGEVALGELRLGWRIVMAGDGSRQVELGPYGSGVMVPLGGNGFVAESSPSD